MNENGLLRLLRHVELAEAASKRSNKELAALLTEMVEAELDIDSPEAVLIGEIADRLRGLDTVTWDEAIDAISHNAPPRLVDEPDEDGLWAPFVPDEFWTQEPPHE